MRKARLAVQALMVIAPVLTTGAVAADLSAVAALISAKI